MPCPNCGAKLRYVLVSAIGYSLHIYDGREYILKELDSNHTVFMCPKCNAKLPESDEEIRKILDVPRKRQKGTQGAPSRVKEVNK
jgi:transcription initiation factor IIE alpha subunit